MRIAQIAPLYEAVPPRMYGGTERVVALLANALVDLGHDVTLFASADANTKAKLIPVRDQAIRLDPAPLKSDLASHMNMLYQVRLRAADFDVLHFHSDMIQFPFFESLANKTITTIHGRLDVNNLAETYRNWSQFPLVSVSNNQRKPLLFANWVATVYHGTSPSIFDFAAVPAGDGYLAFLGRISPEKRPDRAIEIAKRSGVKLKIAAKVDAVDKVYFTEKIEPLLDHPLIEYIGEISDSQKSTFLGNARALLFPIDWPEPFGLVMIEAMACGTPVIAWECGSVPEIVDDGTSGFIVRSEEEAINAVARLHLLDRAEVRRVFESRFSSETMAKRYINVYQQLDMVQIETEAPIHQPAHSQETASSPRTSRL